MHASRAVGPQIRCAWCGEDSLYRHYHDHEWGLPCRDDKKLFEFLILEAAQAGLSWLTILRKRDNYRRAFAYFDADKVAAFTQQDIQRLMRDKGIVRNRLKIESAISNACCYQQLQGEFGSASDYFWRYVQGQPIINHWTTEAEIPVSTPLSDLISRDMNRRGFRFFGSTICYAYLQAMGLVNDHITSCYRHRDCQR